MLLQEMSSSLRLERLQRDMGNCSRPLSERERDSSWWKSGKSSIQPIVLDCPNKAALVWLKDSWRREKIKFFHLNLYACVPNLQS